MKNKFYFILLLTAIFLSSFTLSSSAQILNKDSITKLLTNLWQESNSKAVIAGVWKADEQILSTALGKSMTEVPADTDMHIRIGGISEIFLGTLLMILVDDGRISLDDKISRWIPELLAANKVTVGMLIHCMSGYKDYVLDKEFVNLITKEPFHEITRQNIIDYSTSGGQLEFSPGTDQKYSHTDFTILGEVIERATGRSMQELYEELIFNPLGLSQTGYSNTPELPFPVLHAFSSDRGIYEDATYWNPSWTGESGPLYSTLNNLGKFARKFGTGAMLSQKSFQLLTQKPEIVSKPDQYFACGFGVVNGWYVQNPSFNGYSGAFGYLPSKELTIIIFSTQSESSAVAMQAFDILKEVVKYVTPSDKINF